MAKFTKSEIRKYAPEITYWRGLNLEESNGVLSFGIYPEEKEGKEFMGFHAAVRGSSSASYKVSASLKREDGSLYSAYCECPAFAKYEGMCKHCVAMFLHYFKDEDYYLKSLEENGFSKGFEEKRRTDSGLSLILKKYEQKERQQISLSEPGGQIHLEPTLIIDRSTSNLSFRIGAAKMYVVKDVYDMVKHVREGTKYSYGKNLAFTHRMEAFDEKSRLILDFLMRKISFDYRRIDYGQRYFPVYGSDADEFLVLMGYEGLLVDLNRSGARNMVMTNEPFRQKLSISAADGGAVIKSTFLPMVSTNNYNYYFNDGVIYRQSRSLRMDIEEVDKFFQRYRGNETFVSEDDLPLFVRGVLPLLEKYYVVEKNDIDFDSYLPEEAEFNVYLDLPQDNMVTCELTAVYSDAAEHRVFEGIPKSGNRNVPAELKARAQVMLYCNAFDDAQHLAVMADDDSGIYTLLTDGIADFKTWADVYVSDRLRRISAIRRPQVTVGVSLSGDLLNLKVSSDDIPLEELAAILSKYDRKKKFIRLRDGSFLSTDDENLETLAQVKKGLMLSDKDFAGGQIELPKFRAMYLESSFSENSGLSLNKSRDFRTLIRNMHTVEESDYEVPEAFADILREYQKTGYRWLETLYANGFGGILADDMGLGKTLQVITFLYAHFNGTKEPKKALIVCPASLVYNWEDEFARFAPGLPVYVIAKSSKERQMMRNSLPEQAIVITSYDLLKRDIDDYQKLKFDYQILDEAQFIKNAATRAAQAAKKINSSFRIALTGTPVENRLSELWSIFDYLMPGYLFSYQKFKNEIETPIVVNNDNDVLKRVQKMIAPFVLRRLKKDVLKDLPDKIERNMAARMGKKQKQLYDAHVKRLMLFLDKQAPAEFDRAKIQILAELTKLRQLCCDPGLLYENYEGESAKLDLCMELIGNAVEGGHKIVVFSQFTSMLALIADSLRKKKIEYYMLTGSTPKQERIRLVNAFNGNKVPVFAISLKAGGTGLNLTSADIVIHYDPWWNTAAQNQATDRTHRIGQKSVVTVYKLIAKDTIEENIVQLQGRKQQLADAVLEGSEGGGMKFSKEELLKLLGNI